MLGGRGGGGGYSDCLFGRNVEDKKKISLQLKKKQPLTLILSFESCISLHRATQIQVWKSRCFIFVFVHFRPLFQDKGRLEWLLWRRLLAFLVAWNMFVWAAHVRTFEVCVYGQWACPSLRQSPGALKSPALSFILALSSLTLWLKTLGKHSAAEYRFSLELIFSQVPRRDGWGFPVTNDTSHFNATTALTSQGCILAVGGIKNQA